MNLDDLRTANFDPVDDAVSQWGKVHDDVGTLADEARGRVKGSAEKAAWEGRNATVTREFVRKSMHELDEMEQQSGTIHAVIRDTTAELRTFQRNVNTSISEAPNLHVRDAGHGRVEVRVRDGAPEGTDPKPLEIYLNKQLDRATEVDNSARDVLKSLMGLTDMGFSGVTYEDRDAAAKALADAERAAKLARQSPEDISPREFDELNRLLGAHHDEVLFAERFAIESGPGGVLDFWAGLNTPHLAREIGAARVSQYDELQKNLGLTLAQATQSDSVSMRRWEHSMVEASARPVMVQHRTLGHGVQVMSSLMRWGDFDNGFLDAYGNRLIALEKELSGNGSHPRIAWHRPMTPMFNRTGTDGGMDPMTGYMKALSHSPEAATEFFNDTFVTKHEDHEFKDADGNKRGLSVFDYLFEERKWLEETNARYEPSTENYDALGEALEAATTGHPAGAPASPATPPHTPAQAQLMSDLVASVAEDETRLIDHRVMGDSVGQMVAEYLPDIYRAMTDDPAGSATLFPVEGARAEMSHHEVTRFLVSVGQVPEAYKTAWTAHETNMYQLMDYHLSPEVPPEQRYPGGPEAAVRDVARRSAELGATLAIGKQEAILGPAQMQQEAYKFGDKAQESLVASVAGAGVGALTDFLMTSPAGAGIRGAFGGAAAFAALLIDETQQQPDFTGEAMKEAGPLWERAQDNQIQWTRDAVGQHAGHHENAAALQNAAREGVKDGFAQAQVNVKRMADDLLTDVN